MFGIGKKWWFIATLAPEGDRLTVYKYGKKKMTRGEVIADISKTMVDYPTLFVVFSAKKVLHSGICNSYDLDSIVQKLRGPSKGGISVMDLTGDGPAMVGKKAVN